MFSPAILSLLAAILADQTDSQNPELVVLNADAVDPRDLPVVIEFANDFAAKNTGDPAEFAVAFAYGGGVRAEKEGRLADYFDLLLDGNRPASILEFGTFFEQTKDELVEHQKNGRPRPAMRLLPQFAASLAGTDPAEVLAADTARIDMVREVLAGMKGRTFGVDYTKADGSPRTMLAQIETYDPTSPTVTVREVNMSKRLREETRDLLFSSGIVDRDFVKTAAEVALTPTEARAATAFRTLTLSRIDRIRSAGETHDFAATFAA